MQDSFNLHSWQIIGRLVLAASLAACAGGDEPGDTDSDQGPPPPPLQEGAPLAGAAEGVLEMPIGTPLAGFTSRCTCLGSTSKQDDRDSAYTDRFVESTGVHIRPTIKAIWITNDDRHLLITKTDTIYSFDGLVEALTAELESRTGQDLAGQVVHTANHNHSSYGTYSQHTGLFLGHDKFHRENFQRMVEQIADVAEEAWNNRTEAALGMGITKDWDPNNRVYSDRRGINNELVVFDDMGPEQGAKDPHMHLLRVDEAASGDPIAVLFAWGMHPYVFGESEPLATADATALVEAEVSESFDNKVVSMFVQTGGGDASVRGADEDWARMETVGLFARDAILALREDTPTTTEPILLETMSRSVPMQHDQIRVTRGGKVDWHYGESWAEEDNRQVDNEIYDADGNILSPLDEWTAEYGAVFCGSGFGDLPVGKLATNIDGVYRKCIRIPFMASLVKTFFDLTDEDIEPPMDGLRQTYAAASRIGPIPVHQPDGTDVEQEVVLGFFPGETMHFYTEMWRHRMRDELGINNAVMFGYSMDHEGYLTIPEDWLLGEYESDITFQGPLAAEWIMENVIGMVDEVLSTDVAEPFDGTRGPDVYDEIAQATVTPDTTPNAGTRLGPDDLPEYFWIPDGFTLDVSQPTQLRRVQDQIQVAWEGGDPAVDNPSVTLERQEAGGDWVEVTSHTGRVINEDHHDFAIGHTPDPLFPAEAAQRHYYWAVWQAVGHVRDRAGLPLGTYRLRIDGHSYGGANDAYPWDATEYSFTTDSFEIVPADVTVQATDTGLTLWMQGPSDGYRLVDIQGFSRGRNPLRGPLTVTWTVDDGGSPSELAPATVEDPEIVDNTGARDGTRGGWTVLPFPADETVLGAVVTDAYGNTVSWSPPG